MKQKRDMFGGEIGRGKKNLGREKKKIRRVKKTHITEELPSTLLRTMGPNGSQSGGSTLASAAP